jgi:hypothetical protein
MTSPPNEQNCTFDFTATTTLSRKFQRKERYDKLVVHSLPAKSYHCITIGRAGRRVVGHHPNHDHDAFEILNKVRGVLPLAGRICIIPVCNVNLRGLRCCSEGMQVKFEMIEPSDRAKIEQVIGPRYWYMQTPPNNTDREKY